MKDLSGLRLVILLAGLLMLCLQSSAQTEDDLENIDQYIKIERLSDRVVVIKTGVNYFDAVTAVATQKGIVVIDAGFSPTLTKKYRTIIEKEFWRDDFAYVINTHSHWDHTNGNKIFPEAAVVGHQDCRGEMIKDYSDKAVRLNSLRSNLQQLKESVQTTGINSEDGQQLDYRKSLVSLALADLEADYAWRYPTTTFQDSFSLDMGDRTFQLIYFGKAHSETDVLVYIPEEKLLMAGDLFNKGGGGNLSKLNHGDIKKADLDRWHEALNFLSGPQIEIDRIRDGHAAMLTKADLTAFGGNVEFLRNEFNSGRELSARARLSQVLSNSGLKAMLKEYRAMKKMTRSRYYFFESEFIDLGYHRLNDQAVKEAIEVFKIAVEKFPDSWNAYGCLAEAYLKGGKTKLAIVNYEKSLKLNPQNENAQKMLSQLWEKLNRRR